MDTETLVSGVDPDALLVGFTILKIPGVRPDLFTLVHIVQPIAEEGRLAFRAARWRKLTDKSAICGTDAVSRTLHHWHAPCSTERQ